MRRGRRVSIFPATCPTARKMTPARRAAHSRSAQLRGRVRAQLVAAPGSASQGESRTWGARRQPPLNPAVFVVDPTSDHFHVEGGGERTALPVWIEDKDRAGPQQGFPYVPALHRLA